MKRKNPTITVAASDSLLRVLHAADLALKASRTKTKPALDELHALIVQVAAARMRVESLLSVEKACPEPDRKEGE